MNQTLHIFAKDTRRFWLEILASFLALAIYVVYYHSLLNVGRFNYPFSQLKFKESSTILLVVAAWWLLIARVIHAESQVGDTQFWLTKPYRWKSLLAAKALFIALWVYVPFVIAQMLVLMQAGFPLLSHGSGWFLMLSYYSGCFILPMVVVAAITANFARMTLTLFIGYAAIFACYVSADHPWLRESRVPSHGYGGYGAMVPYPHSFLIVVWFLVGGVAIVVLQYARRRVWLSRGLTIGVAVLTAGNLLALSGMEQREIEHQFPAAGAPAHDLQIAYAPEPDNPLRIGVWTDDVFIALPIQLTELTAGTAADINDMQFSIDAADGSHWTSSWRQLLSTPFLPGTHAPSLPFILGRAEYERFKSQTVTLKVTLAVTELRAGNETTAAISDSVFPVNNFGVCSTTSRGEPQYFLFCRSEFGELPLTYVSAAFSHGCSGPQSEAKDVRNFAEWTGQSYSDPLDAASGLVRVTYTESGAYDSNGGLHGTRDLVLCPGTPAKFTHYDVVRRSRAYLTIPNFQFKVTPE